MTPSACICGKWGLCLCLRAKAKSKSPSALSGGSYACSKLSRALRSSFTNFSRWATTWKKGVRSIKEVVTFDEEEITDDILQNRLKEFTGKIDELAKHYKKAGQLQEKFALVSQKKRPKDHRKYRMALGRGIVRVSLAVRTLGFTNNERKRLIERVNKTVDGMRSLDRQAQNLERKADATRSEDQKKEYRRQARSIRAEMEKLEQEAGVLFLEIKRTQPKTLQGV